ncbi:influenza virus NS1A binding protein [Echinococcus multilocularis]|uniref:Influenza virus NS1A binding protein n=1 Tax=Echinococcus multilocularis TaxID=6211 RepID=A0A068Y3T1_ECHMU|nr:influenza virus NS1A binding protein [Echinococcus multilocularis]
MWSCSPKLKGNALTYNVIFRFPNSSFSCEKLIFGSASYLFKQIFDAVESDSNLGCLLWPAVKVCSYAGNILIDLEEAPEAFEAIHQYLHDPSFEIDFSLLPSVCKIAKKYQFYAWRTFGEILAKSISLENIGEICPLVILSSDQTNASSFIEDVTSQELAAATRSFLTSNADAIASSQTGQLSARLFIDVIEGLQSPQHESSYDVGPFNDTDDWILSERVLFYCSRRIQDREPLDKGNCVTFEDNATRRLNNKIHAPASDTVTDEIRMTISDTQLMNFDKFPLLSQLSLSSEPGEQVQVAEVGQQMSSGNEAVLGTPSPTPPLQPMSPLALPPSRPAFSADMETCVLAKTSLGAGPISIHLGKLKGRLVSISMKRRRAPSGPGSSASSSVVGGGGAAHSTTISLPTSIVLPPSPPPVNTSTTTVVIPSTISTLAAASRHRSPLAQLGAFLEPLHYDYYPHECSSSGCIHRRDSILRSFGCLSTLLLESRSAAGACTIYSTIEDGEDEASRTMSHFILVAGGTSYDRCLNSTEILRISRPLSEVDSFEDRRASVISANSDFESVSNFGGYGSVSLTTQSGPAMHSSRGRLAVAALEKASCAYACGGCDGNNDLATVECLSFDSKIEHYKKWRFVNSMQQERSCCAVATLADESRIVVMGGQCEGSPLSSVEVYYPDSDKWLNLPSMSEGRSQLCAASLSQRNLIVAVGGVSETASTPSTHPFNTSIPNVVECTEFSPSGEAYDPRCAHWIRLPKLLIRGPLIGAALVPLSPSSGRLLLIGGSDGLSTLTQTQIFDSRTWSWLPGPSLSIGRASPCAVSLTPPSIQSTIAVSLGVPCIAVIGGYNLSAGGFLNSVEIIGVTGSSGQISPLNVPSSTSPKAFTFAPVPGVSADNTMTPLRIPAHHDTSPPVSPPPPSPPRGGEPTSHSPVGIILTN